MIVVSALTFVNLSFLFFMSEGCTAWRCSLDGMTTGTVPVGLGVTPHVGETGGTSVESRVHLRATAVRDRGLRWLAELG